VYKVYIGPQRTHPGKVYKVYKVHLAYLAG